MASKTPEPAKNSESNTLANVLPTVKLPEIATTVQQNVQNVTSTVQQNVQSTVEQNVKPTVTEAQRVAAETSVSGRQAVSRGTIILVFYLWVLSGAALLSFLAHYTDLFPGDRSITRTLQRQHNPWFRRFMAGVSQLGFPAISAPLAISTAGIFWFLRFRLEAFFILLTTSSNILSAVVKRVIKRQRPTQELVSVVRVIDEPSFPSGHVMHYTNFYGLLIYLLATNWPSGKLRNALIAICAGLIACVGPSRIYLGAHWPSDVMAGYIYGGLWFGGIMALYLRFKAWLHHPDIETPEVMKPLKQPGEQES